MTSFKGHHCKNCGSLLRYYGELPLIECFACQESEGVGNYKTKEIKVQVSVKSDLDFSKDEWKELLKKDIDALFVSRPSPTEDEVREFAKKFIEKYFKPHFELIKG